MSGISHADELGHDFLRSVGGVLILQGNGEHVWNFGVLAGGATRRCHLFADGAGHLAGSGAGKTVLLYEAARQILGRDLDPGPQKIGDCVSWGWAGSADLLACVQVAKGAAEAFDYEERACTEAMYALSRVEYGNLDGSYSDGSVGTWAADAASKGGTFSRRKLGPYDPQRAKQWGARGVPDDIEPEGKKHLVKTVTLVSTFEEARDAIANGYPVPVCSGQGFSSMRDSQGFARAQGSWAHCMKFIGCRDDSRPGLLCMNSWGTDWIGGPKGEHDIPEGSFWVEASVCTRMLRERDSFAMSSFVGYPSQTIPWLI